MPTVQELSSRVAELEARQEAARREGESCKRLCRELNHAQELRDVLEILIHALPDKELASAQLYRCPSDDHQAEVIATWAVDGLLPVPMGQVRTVPAYQDHGQSGQILLFDDYAQVQADCAFCDHWINQGYQAGAYIFLVQSNGCVGGLHLQWEQPRNFSPQERQIFENIATFAPAVVSSLWLRQSPTNAWDAAAAKPAKSTQQPTVPVIPMVDGLVVLPLIGDLDAAQTEQLNEAIYTSMERYHAHYIIIDVTGIPLIDSTVIYHLLETIRSTTLHGVEVMVTGTGTDTLDLLDELGVPWDEIQMVHDLQSGLMIVLDQLGFSLKRYQRA